MARMETRSALNYKLLASLAGLMGAAALAGSLSGLLRVDGYRPFMGAAQVPGAIGQDFVSLLVATSLPWVMLRIREGSRRALALLGGLSAYLFYAFALYAFEGVYTAFYFTYLLAASAALFTAGYLLVKLVPPVPADGVPKGPLSRISAGFLLFLATGFTAAWIPILLGAIASGKPPFGRAIFVLDLVIYLPLLALAGVQLLRGKWLGTLLAQWMLVMAGALGLSLLVGSAVAPGFGIASGLFEYGLYGVMTVGGLGLGAVFIRKTCV
jgi:hypothetical protein